MSSHVNTPSFCRSALPDVKLRSVWDFIHGQLPEGECHGVPAVYRDRHRTTLGEKGLGAREGPFVRRIQWDIAARFPVRKLMTYSQTAKVR